jgi:uncharacterized protein with PIN domain
MLGSLARWLRFFGFDGTYVEPGIEDGLLAEMARTEGRWLLTRDRALAAVGPKTLLVNSNTLEEQVAEVFGRLGVRPELTLEHARCGECNGDLEDVSRDDIADATPPYVLSTAARFRRCVGCGRVYWPGTHGEKILQRMTRVVELVDQESHQK